MLSWYAHIAHQGFFLEWTKMSSKRQSSYQVVVEYCLDEKPEKSNVLHQKALWWCVLRCETILERITLGKICFGSIWIITLTSRYAISTKSFTLKGSNRFKIINCTNVTLIYIWFVIQNGCAWLPFIDEIRARSEKRINQGCIMIL